MKEIIIEMEVDEPSQIIELPVNEENVIELDFTHLDDELEDIELDGDLAVVTNPATDQNPDHNEEEEIDHEDDSNTMDDDDFDNDIEDDLEL
ncbi:MAG: hypothetical protein AAF039_00825 [Bacteroidota bacterium]